MAKFELICYIAIEKKHSLHLNFSQSIYACSKRAYFPYTKCNQLYVLFYNQQIKDSVYQIPPKQNKTIFWILFKSRWLYKPVTEEVICLGGVEMRQKKPTLDDIFHV